MLENDYKVESGITLVKGKKHLVIKRDNRVEEYNSEKMWKVILWACDGNEILAKELLKDLDIKIYDKIKVDKLMDLVIETAVNKISELFPIWDKVARNLYLQKIYKETWGMKRNEYPNYLDVLDKGIKYGVYNSEVLDTFSKEELKELGDYIKQERDLNFTYLGVKTAYLKYAMKYTKTKILELPQHIFMRVALFSFYKEDKKDRLNLIKKRYDDLSGFYYTEATPKVLNSLRPKAQMSSCVLIQPDDNAESINYVGNAIGLFSKFGGGVAWDMSLIRSLGSIIAKVGLSSGKVPFIKLYEGFISAYNQLNSRAGAGIAHVNWWDIDIFDVLELKEEGGSEEKRARKLQYSIKFNRLFFKKALLDEDVYLFSPNDVPNLIESYGEEFDEYYEEYCTKSGIRKIKVKALDIVEEFIKQRYETGNYYIFFDDNVQEQGTFKENINSSNLCVAPETKILTDKGYETICELEDKWVKVWNGETFKEAYVAKTGENQKLIKIQTTGGELECTLYHKFYVQEGYSDKGRVVEKRAYELQVSDKLIKFDLPIIDGTKDLELAYENGFYSGDGCEYYKTRKIIYLYSDKKLLIDTLTGFYKTNFERDRIILWYKKDDLKNKFYVPNSLYTIHSRVKWFAGLLDSDGTLCSNNGTQSFQISSINYEFLYETLLMLQTLGVTAKLTKGADAGRRLLPKNDGTKELGLYNCKTVYRLLIGESGVQKLLSLGLKTYRLQPKVRKPNRNAEQFIKVTAIIDDGRIDDTYCFNEPDTHLGMFNGLLTGQCAEVVLPTKPLKPIKQFLLKDLQGNLKVLGESNDVGEIALCNLSSINISKYMELENKEKYNLLYNLLKASDNLIDYAFYPVVEGEISNKLRRSIGVGINNYAYYLAKNKVLPDSEDAKILTYQMMEDLSYHLTKVSIDLAKERGKPEWFYKTKYNEGIFPKDLNPIAREYEKYSKYDWEVLRKELKEFGMRFSTVLSIAPTASSSLMAGVTEGIEFPKKYMAIKTDSKLNDKQLLPELNKYRTWYRLIWEISNKTIIDLGAIRQIFIDQSQSLSLAYAGKDKESMTRHLQDILYAEKRGVKTLYYSYMDDGSYEICESCSS